VITAGENSKKIKTIPTFSKYQNFAQRGSEAARFRPSSLLMLRGLLFIKELSLTDRASDAHPWRRRSMHTLWAGCCWTPDQRAQHRIVTAAKKSGVIFVKQAAFSN
jgi:hypothetical protein